MNSTLTRFKALYQHLSYSTINSVDDLYHTDILFEDPFHRINGLSKLKPYFEKLYKNVIDCQFHFLHEFSSDNQAALFWTMELTHKTINKGQCIEINGASLIKGKEKIFYHRDHFDAGALLYEHVPILGHAIKAIKERV